jgi:DNA-binding transcriptional ArsR family regulator
LFRNVSSEESGEIPAGAGQGRLRKITDARAMRALAHPLRIALLEALAHAGTLTATQASEVLGESPANCAFHLRTLAKYGYVEEAGGGRGRERPWQRVKEGLEITSRQDDPLVAKTADELGLFMLDTVMGRARAAIARRASWPQEWQHTGLGQTHSLLYLTPQEASRLRDQVRSLLTQYYDRTDDPGLRPPGAHPLEIVLLSYPLEHLAGREVTPPAGPRSPAVAGQPPSPTDEPG